MTLLNRRSLQLQQTVCAKASDVPVDLYSWQVMDLMLYGTGMYRISQAPASRPLARNPIQKSDRMIFTGNSTRNPRICGPLFWVDPPVGFVQKRINFGGTVPLPPFPSSAVGTRGPHRGGLGEVAQWQEDARLPNLCRCAVAGDELHRRWLSFWTLYLKPRNLLAHMGVSENKVQPMYGHFNRKYDDKPSKLGLQNFQTNPYLFPRRYWKEGMISGDSLY